MTPAEYVGALVSRQGLSTQEVLDVTAITDRQLRWWASKGYIPGPIGGFRGSGQYVRWPETVVEAIQARVAGLKACPDCGPRFWGEGPDDS